MGSLGPFELILIFLAVLLLFGAKRIPEIARGLGKGIREFKTATKEIADEFKVEDNLNRIQAPSQPLQGTTTPRASEAAQPATVSPPSTATSAQEDTGSTSATPPAHNS